MWWRNSLRSWLSLWFLFLFIQNYWRFYLRRWWSLRSRYLLFLIFCTSCQLWIRRCWLVWCLFWRERWLCVRTRTRWIITIWVFAFVLVFLGRRLLRWLICLIVENLLGFWILILVVTRRWRLCRRGAVVVVRGRSHLGRWVTSSILGFRWPELLQSFFIYVSLTLFYELTYRPILSKRVYWATINRVGQSMTKK